MKFLSTPNIIFLLLVSGVVAFLTCSNFSPTDVSLNGIRAFFLQLNAPAYLKFTACIVSFIAIFAVVYNLLRLRSPSKQVKLIDYGLNDKDYEK